MLLLPVKHICSWEIAWEAICKFLAQRLCLSPSFTEFLWCPGQSTKHRASLFAPGKSAEVLSSQWETEKETASIGQEREARAVRSEDKDQGVGVTGWVEREICTRFASCHRFRDQAKYGPFVIASWGPQHIGPHFLCLGVLPGLLVFFVCLS